MIGELNPGVMVKNQLSPEQVNDLLIRLSENPNSDVRDAYNIITILNNKLIFLRQEYDTLMQDYITEVNTLNELIKKVKNGRIH